jgi:hypothetical protein
MLASDAGRARFWCEASEEQDGVIAFLFPNGLRWRGKVLASDRPKLLSLDYFGSETNFRLDPDGRGGTDLTLTAMVPDRDVADVNAGWVSVLLALKAATDFGVDLRNHNPRRTWSQGFADN